MSSGKTEPRKIVVVGSGMTGLVVGALLARLGHAVTVLEANEHHLGGHARTLYLEGYAFCAGPQYVWNFGAGEIGERVLRYLGLAGELTFEKMDADGFEMFFMGDGPPFPVPMGLDRFERALGLKFPGESENFKKLFSAIRSLFRSAQVIHDKGLYLDDYNAMKWGILLSSLKLREKLAALRWSRLTLKELLDKFGISEPARRILYGNGGIFAESESDLSAAVYASAIGYYHQGAYVLKEGFSRLVDGLAEAIARSGGSVQKGKRVVEFVIRSGRVAEVSCADGTRYPCDVVISNISPRSTCQLIPGCRQNRIRYTPSHSFITCFIGLKDYPGFHEKMRGRNFWWQEGRQEQVFLAADIQEPPAMIYLGSPTANGIQGAAGHPQAQSLICFFPGNYDQESVFYRIGKEDQLKATLKDNLIGVIEKSVFPGIRQHILFAEVLTSVDIERALGAERGNAYGRRLTIEEISRGPKSDLGLENLHLASASVGLPGIATSFNTAALLFRALTGIRI